MGRLSTTTAPRFLEPDLLPPSGHLAHSSHKRTLRPPDPARYQRRYTAGTGQVHHQSTTVTRPAQPDPVTERHREPLRHDTAARAAPERAQRPSPRHRARPPPDGGRALGHHLRGNLDEMARADPAARPAAGTNKTSQPTSASRTAKNRPTGPECMVMRQSDEQSRCSYNGTKRAWIGQSERFCAPLVPPGRCPLYVRNHCYASTHGDTR